MWLTSLLLLWYGSDSSFGLISVVVVVVGSDSRGSCIFRGNCSFENVLFIGWCASAEEEQKTNDDHLLHARSSVRNLGGERERRYGRDRDRVRGTRSQGAANAGDDQRLAGLKSSTSCSGRMRCLGRPRIKPLAGISSPSSSSSSLFYPPVRHVVLFHVRLLVILFFSLFFFLPCPKSLMMCLYYATHKKTRRACYSRVKMMNVKKKVWHFARHLHGNLRWACVVSQLPHYAIVLTNLIAIDAKNLLRIFDVFAYFMA